MLSSKVRQNLAVIILAGGRGSRMNSQLPKVLHQIGKKTLVSHTINKLNQLQLKHIRVVVGHKAELVKSKLGPTYFYVEQTQPLGTGHAVLTALPSLPPQPSVIIVVNGDDSAFYQIPTLAKVINQHISAKVKMTIVTTIKPGVEVSGRVIRNQQGKIIGIKSNKQMSEEELKSNNEMVCGLYLFDRLWLDRELPRVEISPKGEYNITALISRAIKEESLQDIQLKNSWEWQSVNTQAELKQAHNLWKKLKAK